MLLRLRQVLAGYPELVTVVVAGAVGLSVQAPFQWITARQGINVLLAILVFATAITIEPAALRSVGATWRVVLVSLFAGVTILPALSWSTSRFIGAGSLRDGVMTVGLAPCEIASIATTAMAGGAAALSAGVLVGSTIGAVAFAGPILSLEAGHAIVHPGHIVANLALDVALPLAAGVALRVVAPAIERAEQAARVTAVVAVAALVTLIAAEVHLSMQYLAIAGVFVVFIAASAVLGIWVGRGSRRPIASAVLLTMSMRDFAIAAGIATAAFGAGSAAPLGLYGVLVLVWGTGVAGTLRRRGGSP